MTFAAQMRIGSLEIVAMLAFAAAIAARPRITSGADDDDVGPVKAVLRLVELGRERLFEGVCPVTIGRDKTVELVLTDPEVSRRHARLESEHGIVFVRDLESRNGTFLNGRRVDGVIETRKGDTIDVGTTRMTVEQLQLWM
jgi:pSer/pThr/pTyr-binding forkhead associated (FHA) protein